MTRRHHSNEEQMGSTRFDGEASAILAGPAPSPNQWIDRGDGCVRVGDRA
jgi:hypothetical protein